MQLPWVNAPQNTTPGQLGSIGDSLVGAARAKQDNSRYAAEMLRQQRQDEERAQLHAAQIANMQGEQATREQAAEEQKKLRTAAAIKDVQASIDAGRVDEAKLKIKAYGLDAKQNQAQQAGDTLMPMSPERPGAPADDQVQDDAARSAATIAENPEMNEPGAPAPNSPGLVRDLYNSRSAARFEAQAPAKPKSATWNIGGETYDPAQTEAAATAEREKTATRVEGAYEPLGYGKQAGALARGDTGKTADIDTLIAQRMKADAADKDRRDLVHDRQNFQQQENDKYRRTFPQAMALADKANQGKVAAAQAYSGPKQDQNTLQAFKHVDQVVHQHVTESGLPKLMQTNDLFDVAQTELEKPSGAAQVGARMAIERALRGGPPTQYKDEQERIHIGGFKARLEGALQTFATGEFGEAQKEAIRHEIEGAREEYQKFLARRTAAIGNRLKNDTSLGNMQQTAGERYKQLTANMGLPSEELFPGASNNLPPIGTRVVEASKQPSPTVGDKLKGAAAKRPGRAAARTEMMAPAAKEATEWLRANPNDPKAEAVRAKLKSMGAIE